MNRLLDGTDVQETAALIKGAPHPRGSSWGILSSRFLERSASSSRARDFLLIRGRRPRTPALWTLPDLWEPRMKRPRFPQVLGKHFVFPTSAHRPYEDRLFRIEIHQP